MAEIIWVQIKKHNFLMFTLFFLVMLELLMPKTSDLALETRTNELCNSVGNTKTEYERLNAELRCASAMGMLYAIKVIYPDIRK